MPQFEKCNRRNFLAAIAASGTLLHTGSLTKSQAAESSLNPSQPQRITLAQLTSTANVQQNLAKAEAAFQQAAKDKAHWLLFPELFLTGSYNGNAFQQAEVASAFEKLKTLSRSYRIVSLIGTGWREDGKTYNQVRIIDTQGRFAGAYAKTCLTYEDSREFDPGPLQMMHKIGGITFGILICNDLWVTPGYTDGPDPRLSLQHAKAGAQVIFHAVGSGSDKRFQAYQESNLLLRAAEARCPIVAVNAFAPPAVNAASGVVGTEFAYTHTLPRNREGIETVEFFPKTQTS